MGSYVSSETRWQSVPRIRFSFDEAQSRAEALAVEFVATQLWGSRGRCIGTTPATHLPQGRGSKHPTVWSVGFVFYAPDPNVAVDGGELFVAVDLETEQAWIDRYLSPE